MMGPPRREPIGAPGWNDKAAVAILVAPARRLLAVELQPLAPERLAVFVTDLDLPALVVLCAGSPEARVCEDAARLHRLARASPAASVAGAKVILGRNATAPMLTQEGLNRMTAALFKRV
jgi:hypothetical protein